MGEKIPPSEFDDSAFAFEIKSKEPSVSSPEEKVMRNLGLRVGDRLKFRGNDLEYQLEKIENDRRLNFIRLYFKDQSGARVMHTLEMLQADTSCFTKLK